MSRIGKKPIEIPDGVEVTLKDNTITAKGPLGQEELTFRPEIKVSVDGKPSEAYIHDKSLLRNGNIFQTLHGEKYHNLPDGRTQVNVLPRRAVCGNSELSRGEAYQEIYKRLEF